MKIPDKVRAGDKLSARWLNQMIDCLTEFSKATGIEGASGQSRSTIKYAGGLAKDTKYRDLGGNDFPLFIEKGFELRLKPEHLCLGDDGSGEESEEGYKKILQVRSGLIVDYRGNSYPVPFRNSGSGEYGSNDQPVLTTWVDMFEISETPQSVYCIIRLDGEGDVVDADFALAPEPYQSWQDSSVGVISVLIGHAYCGVVEEETHFYIDQVHIGAIELQVCSHNQEGSGSGSYGSGSGSEAGSEAGSGSDGSGSDSGSDSGSCDCIRYVFDPAWFIVTGNAVTLNTDTINELVQEAVDEITLDVQVNGLVEATAYGNLTTNTSGSGSLDGSLTATSDVSY